MASLCFRSSSLDLVMGLRNPWKGLTLTRGGPVSVALVDQGRT